jgi:hypothetical protein
MPIRFCPPDSFDDQDQAIELVVCFLPDANQSIRRGPAGAATLHFISQLEILVFSSQHAARSGPELGASEPLRRQILPLRFKSSCPVKRANVYQNTSDRSSKLIIQSSYASCFRYGYGPMRLLQRWARAEWERCTARRIRDWGGKWQSSGESESHGG